MAAKATAMTPRESRCGKATSATVAKMIFFIDVPPLSPGGSARRGDHGLGCYFSKAQPKVLVRR
jgi:hypothetical protein